MPAKKGIELINPERKNPPSILKTFNLVRFDNVDKEYFELLEQLNRVMHDLPAEKTGE